MSERAETWLRRTRPIAVLLALLAAVVALLAGVQPWFTVDLLDAPSLDVTGTTAAPMLTALSLALAAAAIALSLAPRAIAFVLGLVVLAIGGGLVTVWLGVHDASTSAIESSVAEATGMTRAAQFGLIESVTPSFWPTFILLAGIVALVAGVLVLLSAPRWRRRAARASKYERQSEALDWDVQDRGDDPTAEDGDAPAARGVSH